MSTLAEEKIDATGAASAEDHSGRPSYDDVNVPFVVVLGVISAIVTYVSIVGVQGLYYHWEDAQIREKEYGATIAAARTIEEQKESLNGFNVAKVRTEGEKPVQSIPIDLAMNLTLSRYATDSHSHDDHQADERNADDHGTDDHDSDAGHDENKADSKSEDSAKVTEKVDDQSGVGKSDAEKKSESKDSDKSDKADESKPTESKKEDAPAIGDDKE